MNQIEEYNINSQLITMIADTIIKKQDFFDMFKGKQTEKAHMLHGSQIAKLDQKAKESGQETAIDLFKRVAQGGSSQDQQN